MRRHSLLSCGSALAAFAVLIASACGDDPVAPDYALIAESAHVEFWSIEPDATEAEIEAGLALAEGAFADVSSFLGPANTPDRKIVVYLEGDLTPEDIVYVEPDGAIRLWRTAEDFGGYWEILPLVMVISFRADWWQQVDAFSWTHFGFLEQGFAGYAAARVDPENPGFPFYGFPEDVVAGYWLVTNQAVPLQMLRILNSELSGRCLYQAYALRASWFSYLEETYGREKVFEMMYSETDPTAGVIAQIFGVELAELDTRWASWLVERYSAIEGADALGASYRARLKDYASHFGFDDIYVCEAGIDF